MAPAQGASLATHTDGKERRLMATATSTDGDSSNNTDEVTRKQFLTTAATLGLGGVLGAMIAGPVAGMALAPAVGGSDFEAVNLGPVDDFPEGSYKKVVIAPGEGTGDAYVRERVAFVRRNKAGYKDSLTGKVEKFTIISNTCAHLGCPVTEGGGSFVCPCHGGAYDGDGQVKAGPPPRPLDRYDWKVKGDDLWVTGIHSMTKDGKKKAIHGPGQHTSGIEAPMYALQP